MSKVKDGSIKPKATLVLQYMANVEHPTISHKGELFIATGIPAGASATDDDDDEEDAPVIKKAVAPPVVKTSKKVVDEDEDDEDEEVKPVKKAKSSKRPTDKEMETTPIEELWDMVDEIPGLRKKITAAEGKNTNKKVRTALLVAWAKMDDAPAEDEDDEDEKPVKKAKKVVDDDDEDDEDEAPKKKVDTKASTAYPKGADKIMRQLDAGDINGKVAIKQLIELGADKKLATDLITEFEEDGTAPVESYLKKLGKIFVESEDEDDDEEETVPVKKSKKRAEIEHDELEVDDEVVVKWDDGKEYAGTVVSIGKKGIMIEYEDGDSDLLDDDMVVYKA